jgi:hypothetical protein
MIGREGEKVLGRKASRWFISRTARNQSGGGFPTAESSTCGGVATVGDRAARYFRQEFEAILLDSQIAAGTCIGIASVSAEDDAYGLCILDGGKLIMDTYTEVFGADQREFEKKQIMKLA